MSETNGQKSNLLIFKKGSSPDSRPPEINRVGCWTVLILLALFWYAAFKYAMMVLSK
jgi:hypothetical protein